MEQINHKDTRELSTILRNCATLASSKCYACPELKNGIRTDYECEAEQQKRAADILDEQANRIAKLEYQNNRLETDAEIFKTRLSEVVKERDVAISVAAMLPDICDMDCVGDPSVGTEPCPAYQFPDVGLKGGCMATKYRCSHLENMEGEIK